MKKGAGAPYGNRNAEKWTFKKSVQLFNDAIDLSLVENKQSLKTGDKVVEVTAFKYDFIGEVARELGLYKSIFTELVNKFPSLKRKHKSLVENLEANCFCNAKKGNIKEASAIMNLKSNNNWTDRNQTTQDVTITWNEEKSYGVEKST